MVGLTIGLFAVAVLLVVDIMVRMTNNNQPKPSDSSSVQGGEVSFPNSKPPTNAPRPRPAPSDNEPTFKGSYLSFPTQQPPANAPHAEPAPDDQEPEE
jgi:hypothetical protein